MTTKCDMLLTLVFLRFICSHFNEQKERIAADVLSQIGKTMSEPSAEEEIFVLMMQANKSLSLEICPALMQHIIHESENKE